MTVLYRFIPSQPGRQLSLDSRLQTIMHTASGLAGWPDCAARTLVCTCKMLQACVPTASVWCLSMCLWGAAHSAVFTTRTQSPLGVYCACLKSLREREAVALALKGNRIIARHRLP
jgi:hypothetical protein